MSKGKGGSYRSASSGQFVTAAHGQRSPRTTVHESRGAGSAGGTYRSAISGQFVTTAHGQRNPHTTIKDN